MNFKESLVKFCIAHKEQINRIGKISGYLSCICMTLAVVLTAYMQFVLNPTNLQMMQIYFVVYAYELVGVIVMLWIFWDRGLIWRRSEDVRQSN